MPVQVPFKNRSGECLTFLSDGTPVTVLSWIPGRTVEKDDLTPELCREIGKMTANLHLAAEDFLGEELIRYDSALCEKLVNWLIELREEKRIHKLYYTAMKEALEAIGEYLWETDEKFITLHSDLSLSNILIVDKGLVPIDFSMFGESHPMMDLGGLCGSINDKILRIAVLAGYQEKTGEELDLRGVDCCFALQVLLGIMLHYELWLKEGWFPKKMNDWRLAIFEPLMRGKRVIDYPEI